MPYLPEEDEPEWESWMVAREPVHLFQQDAEAEARAARMRKALDQANTYRMTAKLWEQVQALIRGD